MFDLVIRGATLVSAEGRRAADIGISAGRIAEIAAPDAPMRAHDVLNAHGKLLLPGLVDAHVHLREPGLVHKEGFDSGTRAAAVGGVTTVMVMPTDNPLTLTPAHFVEKRALAEASAHVDFALQAGLGPDTSQVAALFALGAVSFEIFLSDIAAPLLVQDAESLLRCLESIAACGSIAGITPGDHDVVTRRTAEIRARSQGAAADFPGTRPSISEALGIARACVASWESRAHIHIRQLSTRDGARVLTGLRRDTRISAEVTPHNLVLDESVLARLGPFAKVGPPLREADDVEAMQLALRTRLIDMVATDHAPHLPAEKQAGLQDIWKAPSGLPGLQTFLPVMLHLVAEGTLTLEDVVRTCCTEPARRFGLSAKGHITAGADADLLLIDLHELWAVRNEDQLSKARITPFAGLEAPGGLLHVFLRGQEIVRDGQVLGAPGGRFVAPTVRRPRS